MKLATSRNRMKNLPMINHRPDEEDFKQYFKEISSENFTYYDLKLIGPHLPTNKLGNFHEEFRVGILQRLGLAKQKIQVEYKEKAKVKEREINGNDKDFIISALNSYWHQAASELDKRDLGDLERKNYEHQQKRSKELMDKLENL